LDFALLPYHDISFEKDLTALKCLYFLKEYFSNWGI